MRANTNNLTENDVASLEIMMTDMKNGEYISIYKYNLSENALDFLVSVMRKALCPDRE